METLDPTACQQSVTFLGPPLPLNGQLFVLVEADGDIRLLALDAATGSFLWTRVLATVDREMLNRMDPRLSGMSPSYADGILVCPTGGGAVVSVDLATQSLLWGSRYGRSRAFGTGRKGLKLTEWGRPSFLQEMPVLQKTPTRYDGSTPRPPSPTDAW